MVRKLWRQFRTRQKTQPAVAQGSVVEHMHAELRNVLQQSFGDRAIHHEQLKRAIDEQRRKAQSDGATAATWFALLVLQAPLAAQAQQKMDEHPHGYHDKQARLYELIDFNDAYVSTVLALSDAELKGFAETIKQELARFCQSVHAQMFSDEQFDAITRGLSREIAVFRGAVSQGFQVVMTSRTQDALGVDMVITNPQTGDSINVDCKTASSYRYRLQDLEREGRMSRDARLAADRAGYVREHNGHGGQSVEVVLLRIDPNEVGDIVDYSFTQPELLGERLRDIMRRDMRS